MKFIKKLSKRKIKVYYICQYIQGYGKICDVIEAMKKDEKIDIKVLALPDDIQKYPNNPEFSFWKDKFGDIVIDAVTKNGWYDLKKQKPDYVFIQRPYDNYVPLEYSSLTLSTYTKLCYIPYAFTGLIDLRKVALPDFFLERLYFFFADNFYEYEYAKNVMNQFSTSKTKHFSMNLGYPSLDKEIKQLPPPISSSAFKRMKSKIPLKVIWTPRWTTDKNLLQTTFFDYKDKMVTYFQNNKDSQLVFRPHPLAFKNFIDKNLMTQKQVQQYIEKFKEDNMVYDTESEYFETFKDSDVLITDFSSIIIDYFLLGKPIILCNQDKTTYMELMKKIDKVCYSAKNFKEIEKILKDLKSGYDPLKEKREQLSSELFHKEDKTSSSEKIVDCIKNDFYKRPSL